MVVAGPDTSEFRHAFRVETDRMLRRRIFWFGVIWVSLSLTMMLVAISVAVWASFSNQNSSAGVMASVLDLFTKAPGWRTVVYFVLLAAWFLFYAVVIVIAAGKRPLSTTTLVHLSLGLIIADGLLAITGRAADINGAALFSFVFVHFIACCIFPWALRQALIPVVLILSLSQVSKYTIEGGGLGLPWGSLFAALAVLPALGVCWWRHSQRLQTSGARFLQQRYGMLRQELAYARQIHEAMFPEPRREGSLRLDYRYEPMRQIGGDYLHAHSVPSANGKERLSLVILDVTGHGIPAALTVNRLYGEIDLRFADDPDMTPGELLRHLNRYVNLTLARHSIYATALCIRADAGNETIEYASGGHPPAFLRGVDGTIRELDSTTFVLGACADEDFDPQTNSLDFRPGDSVIAYTDGATEARAPDGQMLRISGLRGVLAGSGSSAQRPNPGDWPDHLLRVVANHRGGAPPEDDTLVVELYRPIS